MAVHLYVTEGFDKSRVEWRVEICFGQVVPMVAENEIDVAVTVDIADAGSVVFDAVVERLGETDGSAYFGERQEIWRRIGRVSGAEDFGRRIYEDGEKKSEKTERGEMRKDDFIVVER